MEPGHWGGSMAPFRRGSSSWNVEELIDAEAGIENGWSIWKLGLAFGWIIGLPYDGLGWTSGTVGLWMLRRLSGQASAAGQAGLGCF